MKSAIGLYLFRWLWRVLTGAAVFAFFVFSPGLIYAAGAWKSVGSMHESRFAHTATLLPDGTVMVAGGMLDYEEYGGVVKSAEIYDPSTGTWERTGSMKTQRSHHTATLLPDGRVLVVGGWKAADYGATLKSAEVYDPTTGTWSDAGSLEQPRMEHTATLLRDGRVLIAGGRIDSMFPVAKAEIFDPTTVTWSRAADLTIQRGSHTATLLQDGRVFIFGGATTEREHSTESGDLFDPISETWTPSAPLEDVPLVEGCGVQLPDFGGLVMVVGGSGGAGYLLQPQFYMPRADRWISSNAPTVYPRLQFSLTLLPDGTVLAAGGCSREGYPDSECFDPLTLRWHDAGPMNVNRKLHTATLLPDGTVLAVGGVRGADVLASAEIYAPEKRAEPRRAMSLQRARAYHTATLLPQGQVLAAGGEDHLGQPLRSVEIFNPLIGYWHTAAPMGLGRTSHSAFLLPDGAVLVCGGRAGDGPTEGSELFDPLTKSWHPVGDMSMARMDFAGTALSENGILVTGGLGKGGMLRETETFDPYMMKWMPSGEMSHPRCRHTVTLLRDGRVLAAGGTGPFGPTGTAELYDPETCSWLETGQLIFPRTDHSAVLLPDGSVLVTGGCDAGGLVAAAERFDPTTGVWSGAGKLSVARSGHVSLILRDGTAVVLGGESARGPVAMVEMFLPGTGAWARVGESIDRRSGLAAALLLNGDVMLCGGSLGKGSLLATSETLDFESHRKMAIQPCIETVKSPLQLGEALFVTGTGFRGTGLTEASGGDFRGSPTNYPLVQLRNMASGYAKWLFPDPENPFTDRAFHSAIVEGFPEGFAMVTVYVNGCASRSKVVAVSESLLRVFETDETDSAQSPVSEVYPDSVSWDTRRMQTF